MKAISLWQPWASLMAVGAKCMETRHWPIAYRGPLAIHAAKRKVLGELKEYQEDEGMRSALGAGNWAEVLPFGAVVCVVDLFECQPSEYLRSHPTVKDWTAAEEAFGNFEPGRYGWLTRSLRRLASPVACNGMQGLFDLPYSVEQEVRGQLSGAPSSLGCSDAARGPNV